MKWRGPTVELTLEDVYTEVSIDVWTRYPSYVETGGSWGMSLLLSRRKREGRHKRTVRSVLKSMLRIQGGGFDPPVFSSRD